jgi:hypothetical protein
MPKLNSAQQTELLDLLLDFPGTRTTEQREALLFSLPSQITGSIDLSGDRNAAMVKLVETLEFWGQLADGRWATEVMLRNALRTAKSTQFEQRFEAIRQIFDLPAAKVQLDALPEQIASEISYLMPAGFLDDGQRAARAVARICVPQVFDGKMRVLGSKPSLALGTAWLIAPNLLVTNHHVVAARFKGDAPVTASDMAAQATGAEAWFDYVHVDKPYCVYRMTALEACEKSLDYAVLRVAGTAVSDARPLSNWGYLRLAAEAAAPRASAQRRSAPFRGREADRNPPQRLRRHQGRRRIPLSDRHAAGLFRIARFHRRLARGRASPRIPSVARKGVHEGRSDQVQQCRHSDSRDPPTPARRSARGNRRRRAMTPRGNIA